MQSRRGAVRCVRRGLRHSIRVPLIADNRDNRQRWLLCSKVACVPRQYIPTRSRMRLRSPRLPTPLARAFSARSACLVGVRAVIDGICFKPRLQYPGAVVEPTNAAKGLRFEQACAAFLGRQGIPTTLTGRRGDQGVDFVGWWPSPSDSRAPLRVIGQCKALKAAIGPVHLREFQGTWARFRREDAPLPLGIFCSAAGFTPNALRLATRPDAPPFLLLHLRMDKGFTPTLEAFKANPGAMAIAGRLILSLPRRSQPHPTVRPSTVQ
jgi:hypothetical protein